MKKKDKKEINHASRMKAEQWNLAKYICKLKLEF